MVSSSGKAEHSRTALVFFGTLLCVLLALFAVERRVAAYPTHNVAATATAATGVQKPENRWLSGLQSIEAPVILLWFLALFAPTQDARESFVVRPVQHTVLPTLAATSSGVRPPPAL